jgi:hypothetical protein
VAVGVSIAAALGFLVACLLVVRWIFLSGYRLRT